MFYKLLKFLFLSALTFVWGGCESKDHAVAGYGCISIQCYNTTAVNDAGKVFDIIECEDGYKYLRQPGHYYFQTELQKELPNGVSAHTPQPDNCGAENCKYGPKTCFKGSTTDYYGKQIDYDVCEPIIECPEKK